MSDPFFAFEGFDREIEKKLASLDAGTERVLADYRHFLERLPLQAADHARVAALCERLQALPFDAALYPDYLTHPLRVSASYLRTLQWPSYDDAALSLCHNAVEAGLVDQIGAEYLAPAVLQAIDRLTIDRAREKDPAYLARFYDGIVSAPQNLIVLKALDKLDNTLWWVRFDVERHDVEVVLEHVLPRLAPMHAPLAAYLDRLVAHVLSAAARERYRVPAKSQASA